MTRKPQHDAVMKEFPMSIAKTRFDSRVIRSEGCWRWGGSTNTKGYGRIKINGQDILAHRLAWTLHKGEIPSGMLICHKCDNPVCVNPDHLFIGTQRDNIRDAAAKGRIASGERHGMNTRPDRRSFGSANGQSKLSENSVAFIKTAHKNRSVSNRQLARQFGVSESLICMINRGIRWRHI